MTADCEQLALTFTFAGLLSAHALMHGVKAWADSDMPCRSDCGTVIDLSAVVWLDGGKLDLQLIEQGQESLWRAPVAFVVRPEDERWFQDYAHAQAQEGLVRGTFTELLAARDWVLQKGRVMCQQEAQSRIGTSGQKLRTPDAFFRRPESSPASPPRLAPGVMECRTKARPD
jgi:hypothetical protein